MKRKINGFFMAVAGLAIVSTLILLVFVFHELFGQQVMDDLRTYAFLLQDTCENEEKARQTFQIKEFAMDHPDIDLTPYYKNTSFRPFKVTERPLEAV